MKKSFLNNLIKECIVEVLNEVGQSNQSFYETLGDTLSAVEEYIIKNSIQVDPSLHPSDEADQYGIRHPFLFGGIPYEQKRDSHYKLLLFKGKPTRKYLHVSIYRMPSGRYELTCYAG